MTHLPPFFALYELSSKSSQIITLSILSRLSSSTIQKKARKTLQTKTERKHLFEKLDNILPNNKTTERKKRFISKTSEHSPE